MTKSTITTGPVHTIPPDLEKVINSSHQAKKAWEDITPLARNEWICWVLSAKKDETRTHRIERTKTELTQGMKRPCCWPGCPHRNPNSKKWFSGK